MYSGNCEACHQSFVIVRSEIEKLEAKANHGIWCIFRGSTQALADLLPKLAACGKAKSRLNGGVVVRYLTRSKTAVERVSLKRA